MPCNEPSPWCMPGHLIPYEEIPQQDKDDWDIQPGDKWIGP